MPSPDAQPPPASDVDVSLANAARVYDYWLGGSHNFAVDRDLGERMIRTEPGVLEMARANRAFLGRAVRHCVRQGITQFLDLGSGIPTKGNVHEVARALDPSCRVVYVDNEPVAVAHSERLLREDPNTTVVRGDLTRPTEILASSGVRELLDLTRPVALLTVMVLHYFPGTERVAELLATYRREFTAGSAVVLSHPTTDDARLDMSGIERNTQDSAHPAHMRTRAQVSTLLSNVDLTDDGLCYANEWRPDEPLNAGTPCGVWAAVGHLPGRT